MEEAEHAVGKIGVIVDALDGIDRASGYDGGRVHLFHQSKAVLF